MLNRGYDVFLWDKLIEKIIKNKPNKYKAEKNFKDIVDLNDLVIKSKNSNVYEKLKLSTFFSKDKFDFLYIDKITYNKKKLI